MKGLLVGIIVGCGIINFSKGRLILIIILM